MAPVHRGADFVGADGTLLTTYLGELTPDALVERLEAALGLTWSP